MKAELLAIGTELLMGELADTNSPFLASRLPPLGIDLQWVTLVGDDPNQLTGAFLRGLERSDVIFTTGGLGPTQDDLTRDCIARALDEEIVVDPKLVQRLEDIFRSRGTDMPPRNIKQAQLIPSAQAIPNPRGTAPGWWVETKGKIIVAMPGPPVEMQGMWQDEVAPRLLERARGQVIITRNIKTNGLSEALVDELISPWLGKENPYLGIYAKPDGIHLRIIARATNPEDALAMVRPVEAGVVQAMGPHVWGFDEETPEQVVGHLLAAQQKTLAVMETCSGGQLASSITDVPGASAYFKGSITPYSKEAKIAAGVDAATIERYGEASEETASAMAQAVRTSLQADYGVAITGVAGPGEMEGLPVGVVFVALDDGQEVQVQRQRLPPRRVTIKHRAAAAALIELARVLKGGALNSGRDD